MTPKIEKLQKEFDEAKASLETLRSRSAEDITDADAHNKEYETALSRAESIKASLEAELKAVKTLDSTASLFAELNGLSKAEEAVKVRGAAKDSGDWFFHYLRSRDNADSREVLSRSATLVTSTTSSGLIPYAISGDVTRYKDAERYLMNAFGVQSVVNGQGWRVRTESGGVTVAAQANEGDDVGGSNTLAVVYETVTPATYAGSIKLSLQAMNDTTPGAAELNMASLVREYAIKTDTVVCAAFKAACSYTGSWNVNDINTTAATAAQKILEALYGAADSVYSNSGSHADTLFLSPDVRRWLATRVDTTGAPVFPMLNPSNRNGTAGGANWNDGIQIAGLDVVIDPRFATSTAIVGARRYGQVYESMYPTISAWTPSTLTQEIAYAGELATRFDAKGFIKILDIDGNSGATPNTV